jgi:hypothetical protein
VTAAPQSLDALLEGWTVAYGVTSALVVGDAVEAAKGLARRLAHVVVACPTEAEARVAERALAGVGSVEVRVGLDVAALPRCDLVLTVDGLAARPDWSTELTALADRAARVLVVVLPNPRGALDRLALRARGARAQVCRTDVIAPALWAAGRVREHVYFDEPRLIRLGSLAPSLPARVLATLARRHAFVVDTTPRTPQARRRLSTL